MSQIRPSTTAQARGRPLHPMLVPFPIACFVGTLLTDIAYAVTADMQWANMSAWLLTAGLIVAAFAVLAGLFDFLTRPRVRALPAAWIHGVGNLAVAALSILNAFVHSRDAYTSVVPLGLTLSAVVVLILAVTSWNGWSLVHRHAIGVTTETQP